MVPLVVQQDGSLILLTTARGARSVADGLRRFSFDLEGLPPGASATGAVLKFTLTGPSAAYEYTASLP